MQFTVPIFLILYRTHFHYVRGPVQFLKGKIRAFESVAKLSPNLLYISTLYSNPLYEIHLTLNFTKIVVSWKNFERGRHIVLSEI